MHCEKTLEAIIYGAEGQRLSGFFITLLSSSCLGDQCFLLTLVSKSLEPFFLSYHESQPCLICFKITIKIIIIKHILSLFKQYFTKLKKEE